MFFETSSTLGRFQVPLFGKRQHLPWYNEPNKSKILKFASVTPFPQITKSYFKRAAKSIENQITFIQELFCSLLVATHDSSSIHPTQKVKKVKSTITKSNRY